MTIDDRGTAQLLAAVLDTAVDPILLINPSGTILRVNQRTVDLFGYLEHEMLDKNVSMLMPEPYRSEHDGYIERYLSTGDPHIIGIGREIEAQKSDGSVFPIRLAVSEAVTPQGRVFTGVVHDLTEVRRTQRLLEIANAELEERVRDRTAELEDSNTELARSNRDLEQFAYIASHDLQAPLRNVRQGIELLDDHLHQTVGESFDDEANELRGLITDAVSRMETMIQGLLSYSRVQRREQRTGNLVDLTEVVDEVLGTLRSDIADGGVTVTVEPLPVVHGDPVLLSQLFQNLIENAVKYRSRDRAALIEVRANRQGRRWEVSVIDNGIGISADKHDRIFELFRRAHAGYDGVGMGLAISQRIVERHDGELLVASEPGEGSTFTFSLPAAPVDGPSVDASSRA